MGDIIDAIEENNYLKVKTSLKSGLDPNKLVEISEDEYEPLLFFAVRKRVDLDIIELIIESGANLEHISDDGVGILDEAVIFGQLELIKYLVKSKNFDVNLTHRKSGMTPFMQAACYGDIDLMNYLIECGADINAKDKNGMDALGYTKVLGRKRAEEFLENILKNDDIVKND